jgi:hypothetical protein
MRTFPCLIEQVLKEGHESPTARNWSACMGNYLEVKEVKGVCKCRSKYETGVILCMYICPWVDFRNTLEATTIYKILYLREVIT